jgi:hypothetical protein
MQRVGQTPLLALQVTKGVVAGREGLVAGKELGKPLHSRFEQWKEWWHAESGQTPLLVLQVTKGLVAGREGLVAGREWPRFEGDGGCW